MTADFDDSRVSKTWAVEPIVIKKYANRRLYNTKNSSYVTLEDLCTMSRSGESFVVRDAKTGEDLTRIALAQVILDAESRSGHCMLPEEFMRNLIGFYGTPEEWMVRQYLRQSLDVFKRNQASLKDVLSRGDVSNTEANIQSHESLRDMQQKLCEMQLQIETLIHKYAKPSVEVPAHSTGETF